MRIKRIEALQIYDSRGIPTVECTVELENGVTGTGIVPAGASTGRYEAWELRDANPGRWRGLSVLSAVDSIEKILAPSIRGLDVFAQEEIDRLMIEMDGTENKSSLGANSILAVSMAVAKAAANTQGVNLYEYLGAGRGDLLPLPQIQVFGGGAHTFWRTDVQDFLIIPIGATSYSGALEMAHDVHHAVGDWLRRHNKNFGVADEGGYWPDFDEHTQILDTLVCCIEQAGYRPGHEIAIALDIAASEIYDDRKYRFQLEDRTFSSTQFVDQLVTWCRNYPILSIEDPMADVDQGGWSSLYSRLGDQIQIIGDDLFTTNCARIKSGVERSLANAVLIKLNQIGTVSETMEAIRYTQKVGWRPVISARSGETEDTFICHLAVATNAGQLKVGSFARGERMAKWNELLRIERCLTPRQKFKAKKIFTTGEIPLKSDILSKN